MKKLLICSIDPMLVKSLYGILREEGFAVDVEDHAAFAVQKTFGKDYSAVIIDSETIGLSADDAAEIIRRAAGGTEVIIAGDSRLISGTVSVRKPVDIEELKMMILNMCESETTERKE